jgi:hypothetical protein
MDRGGVIELAVQGGNRRIVLEGIDADTTLAANGFPFPRRGSHQITQADCTAIIEQIRGENTAAFGGGHDGPVE